MASGATRMERPRISHMTPYSRVVSGTPCLNSLQRGREGGEGHRLGVVPLREEQIPKASLLGFDLELLDDGRGRLPSELGIGRDLGEELQHRRQKVVHMFGRTYGRLSGDALLLDEVDDLGERLLGVVREPALQESKRRGKAATMRTWARSGSRWRGRCTR
jgi:hypothetical protein